MSDTRHRTPQAPSLSPVLLAGIALRPLPLRLLRPFLTAALTKIQRSHPEVFERMKTLEDAQILIDPVDLPFSFLVRPGLRSPRLMLVRDGDDLGQQTATIRGPFLVLIDLLEGRLDGDAMFFSCELVIEGDTEAVLTLRNAVDSGEIDVTEDLLSVLGPLKGLARRPLAMFGKTFARAAHDLETLRAAFIAPVAQRCDLQAASLHELEEHVAQLRRQVGRAKSGRGRELEPKAAKP